MFEEFAPLQNLHITLVTERLVVQGNVRVRRQRLVDLLSESDGTHLTLTEAEFREPSTGRVVCSADIAQVALQTVMFAHTTEPIPTAATMRNVRRSIPATLVVGGFTVSGTIHLPMESTLRMALEEFRGRFVAVTNATYVCDGSAEPPVTVDLLALNHTHAHVILSQSGTSPDEPFGDGQSGGSPAGGSPAGGSSSGW